MAILWYNLATYGGYGMGYFKDISDSLSRKYPDRKVYVISDQHFDHRNIIKYTRDVLFGSDDMETSVDRMNEFIISKHNEVVGEDDIVLILGDFSFKKGIERLTELTSKLNGHKFLIMGNHDALERPDLYLKAGFEGVFLNPIKFNGDYYSHYPLNAAKDSDDRPDTVLYKYLCDEFKNADSGINFFGHQHELVNNGKREKNVTCEQLDYKPLFVGRTKSYLEPSDDNIPYFNDEFFEILHEIMSRCNEFQEDSIISDYLYSMLLEILTPYQDQIVAFGSFLMNKKYQTRFNPSDLDVTMLCDPTKSLKTNRLSFKRFGSEIYERVAQIEGVSFDFYKKIDFICILSFMYAAKNNRVMGFLDTNILFDEFYKSEDFIRVSGGSLLESYAKKFGVDTPKTIRYPRFNINTTNALADVVNCFLLYIYSNDGRKKVLALRKINSIIDSINIDSKEDFEQLQNMLIRFLLRNIYFYESSKRKDDSILVLTNRDIEVPTFVAKNDSLGDALRVIVNDREYSAILDSIQNSGNRKIEISKILTYYK